MCLISFSCLIALVGTDNTRSDCIGSGESRHPCLGPCPRKAFSLSSLNMMSAVEFLAVLYQVEKVPFSN